MRRETSGPPPPGLLVPGDPAALARLFPLIAPLQPTGWTADGLVCAPRAAGEPSPRPHPALGAVRLDRVPGWPTPPSLWLGGWYVRSPGHAAGPPGVRELVVVPGDGFGPAGHVTTGLCLAALGGLPDAAAVDVGCGAGLLTQAWLRLGRGPVLAVDLDPAAVAQTRASLAACGLGDRAEVRRGPAEHAAGDLGGRVLLANLPAAAHHDLHACMHAPPLAAVLSGLRPGQGAAVAGLYRRRGLRACAAHRRAGWECWVLAG